MKSLGDNLFSAQLQFLDSEEQLISEANYDNIEIKELQENTILLTLNGRQEEINFYNKEGDAFIFDKFGNCFRTANLHDLIEVSKEEIVDKERISAPMPGVVVQIAVNAGDQLEKVTNHYPML